MLTAALLLQAAAPVIPPPVSDPCRREEKHGDGIVVVFGPDRECRPWRSPRVRSGVWIFQFEGSRFVDGAETLAEADARGWRGRGVSAASFDKISAFPGRCNPVMGRAYRVAGTMRAAVPREHRWPAGGGFGHMGLWSSEVLFDRIRTMVDLGELPGDQVRAVGLPPRACVGAISSDSRR